MVFNVALLLLAVIVVATFLLQGRQWLTAITAVLLGMFLGQTGFGHAVIGMVTRFLNAII